MLRIFTVLLFTSFAVSAFAQNRTAPLTIDTVIEKCDSTGCAHQGITVGTVNIDLTPDSVNANNQQQYAGKWSGTQGRYVFTVTVFDRVDEYDNHTYYDISLEITDTATKQTTQSAVFDLRALSSMNTTVLWNSEAQLYVGPAN